MSLCVRASSGTGVVVVVGVIRGATAAARNIEVKRRGHWRRRLVRARVRGRATAADAILLLIVAFVLL